MPTSDHTKLALEQEGLDFIKSINTKIAVVMVIGPYRSGKSFLLNQMLRLSCEHGFGVGHRRAAQTKGIWVWSEPVVTDYGGDPLSVLYVDSEGFESTGQSDVYDDRIFALSALISSVLIYNLPETVKEADIEKLSFAVELAEEFHSRIKGDDSSFQLPVLLWLLQRDFLEGRTVKKMVDDALQMVDNPTNDKGIQRLNEIRSSLKVIGEEYTAFGLTQPHLKRTQLCDMTDKDFDPTYVQQRDDLRILLTSLYRPKSISGAHVENGLQFSAFLETTVSALNKQDIPSARSITETFNQGVIEDMVGAYRHRLESIKLPVGVKAFATLEKAITAEVRAEFQDRRFGNHPADMVELEKECNTILKYRRDSNAKASMEGCAILFQECESTMDLTAHMRLPSMKKFKNAYSVCNATFSVGCIGPSRVASRGRLDKLWERESKRFQQDYNAKILQGLSMGSIISILLARFVFKSSFIEFLSWCLFIVLEIYPKLFMFNNSNMFESVYWVKMIEAYELIVFNDFYDLNDWLLNLLVFLCVYIFYEKFIWMCFCLPESIRGRKKKSKRKRKTSMEYDEDDDDDDGDVMVDIEMGGVKDDSPLKTRRKTKKRGCCYRIFFNIFTCCGLLRLLCCCCCRRGKKSSKHTV